MIDLYGLLCCDLVGLFDFLDGFFYWVLLIMGEEMLDGLFVVGDFDGMGCFVCLDGLIILVCNYEFCQDEYVKFVFGLDVFWFDCIDCLWVWDWIEDGCLYLGGISYFIVNLDILEVECSYMFLVGINNNCVGGVIFWGSWIICEEIEMNVGLGVCVEYGYNFEVLVLVIGFIQQVLIIVMGCFCYEVVVVDLVSGVVFQIEDQCGIFFFYCYLLDVLGEFVWGGCL